MESSANLIPTAPCCTAGVFQDFAQFLGLILQDTIIIL